ncbi:Glutamine cyclotransferase [Planctopirus ephydatiae]|uniref:Glutamine cyclotransferase n=1 Tax=Planctopirus ephydatiae TaxID=2528019 RepID=A0A518GN31_9PLAN|nr:glutaminyl-peptide cyclotransferase [Planctopirus ephydatiae]QDV30030.1 Glutamine cyclotransferase [Planctopirus ephydatiae]
MPIKFSREWSLFVALCCMWTQVACDHSTAHSRDRVLPVEKAEVVAAFPHDPEAFSQGLVVEGGTLYESTGLFGSSSLRIVDLETGKVQKIVRLNDQYFGEGLTKRGDQLIQITWKNREAFVFDAATLEYKSTIRYAGEGWGLTRWGEHLVMSDGSSVLKVLEPETFRVLKKISVRADGRAVSDLNELETVGNEIWANIWHRDLILRIDPRTGEGIGWIDLSHLFPSNRRPHQEAVLNGIAYDPVKGRLFVTGKNWPQLFEIRVASLPEPAVKKP